MMNEEGYIKFECVWQDSPVDIPVDLLNSLNAWRNKLYRLSLVGAYTNGVGFGNISIKKEPTSFYITGSATGVKPNLDSSDYAWVTKWEIKNNRLFCTGKTRASSESLTHAAIYASASHIHAVIHIHSENMWNYYRNLIPTTSSRVEFGTPEMALEMMRLLKKLNFPDKGLLVMGGHREGILAFGKTLDEAGNHLLDHYYHFRNNTDISEPA
jgi:ribulose-5-phosphate 4-epimerase/fuculose-1-phosphate aldolase